MPAPVLVELKFRRRFPDLRQDLRPGYCGARQPRSGSYQRGKRNAWRGGLAPVMFRMFFKLNYLNDFKVFKGFHLGGSVGLVLIAQLGPSLGPAFTIAQLAI